jgi:hypothetical protein
MAFLTAISEIGGFLLRRGHEVRVVTRNATQLALRALKTPAFVHLLDLTGEPVVSRTFPRHERRPELIERQARPKVFTLNARPAHAPPCDQVALLAHRVPKRRLQMRGVHDRHVSSPRHSRTPNVQLSGTVAALTTDGMSLKDWRPVPVDRSRRPFESIAVTEQAVRQYRPVKVVVPCLITRRQIPAPATGIPGDRRLEKEPITLDQVRECLPPGADHVLNLRRIARDASPRSIAALFLVDDAIPLAQH